MNIPRSAKERLARRIAGEIALSSKPYKTMRKWRELFHIPQIALADFFGVSPSVISDYESGRRKSPGTQTIKRIVNALLAIDEKGGGQITLAFSRLMDVEIPTDIILDALELTNPMKAREFCKLIGANIVVREKIRGNRNIHGYIVIDNIAALRELSSTAFQRLFDTTIDYALIFTNVSTGRSPMITINIGGTKPKLVILHGMSEIDHLAIGLAKKEKILLATLEEIPINTLFQRLGMLQNKQAEN
ncbi:MAG: helix-turn-helix domain-containing protein [Candidatus Hodarchaeota archaeon]